MREKCIYVNHSVDCSNNRYLQNKHFSGILQLKKNVECKNRYFSIYPTSKPYGCTTTKKFDLKVFMEIRLIKLAKVLFSNFYLLSLGIIIY